MRYVNEVMGMPVTIEVAGNAEDALIESVYDDLRRVDAVFSTFRWDSAVSRINRCQPPLAHERQEVEEVLSLCRSYERSTGGAFAAWRDNFFDPSGLVKGWALDRAASTLSRAGIADFYVDGAGDVLARGSSYGKPWRIGIRHPWQRDKVVRVIAAQDLAVATSGSYEKGRHIVDPRSGKPACEYVSLTVCGPDMVAADVYATAAFVMGRPGLDLIRSIPLYEAYAIDIHRVATFTPGFDALCEPVERRAATGQAGATPRMASGW